jgi:biotin carboxyl carrier protein
MAVKNSKAHGPTAPISPAQTRSSPWGVGVAEYTIRMGDTTRHVDDTRFTVESIGDGIYTVSDGVTRWRVVIAGPASNRWVFADGRVAQVEVAPAGRAAPRARSHVHDMSAPMPAMVVKVLVEPGAQVSKGDTVVMLEAMKMELPIRAARDGIVRTVQCRPGELVQPGVNLVELES